MKPLTFCKALFRGLAVAGALGFQATCVFAQGEENTFVRRSTLQTGGVFQRWVTDVDQRVTGLTLPFAFTYAATEKLSFSLFNSPTRSTYRRVDKQYSLAGLTDTKFTGVYLIGDEAALLTFGCNVPTGKTELKNDSEVEVARVIAAHALNMYTPYFGGGFDVNLGITSAREAGSWVLGASVSYLYKGSYVPIEQYPRYRPGGEFNVSLGADHPIHDKSRVYFDFTYTYFAADHFQSKEYYRAGARLVVESTLISQGNTWGIEATLRGRLRAKNQSLQFDTDAGDFILQTESRNANNNELLGDIEIGLKKSPRNTLLGVAGFILATRNDFDSGGAVIFAIGGGWRTTPKAGFQFDILSKVSFGRLYQPNTSVNIRGIDLSIGVVYGW